ncbi:5-oxoprolinase subunit PxpB [Bacillus dakarensis]|uniref:5-oxoprolinase subunit PxpB n=1 Tax=Robertmurraya dakarensis TaxID=1926278 RepID=UPI000980B9D0|nr:5-oxoprolinase subunit PxpB [Bacillus dakarensis]
MTYVLHPMGDHAVVIEIGSKIESSAIQTIQEITNYLDETPPKWMIEYIPAFTTVTIVYDPIIAYKQSHQHSLPIDFIKLQLHEILSNLTRNKSMTERIIEIPVCYGEEYGPDIETVAEVNGLSVDEVIELHSSANYLVYMIGFSPGFPYLGGMSERIATPRRKTPRLTIPARSVGIAGMQTGIYPIDTPGGWQLIGRTPIKLFQPEKEQPSLLRAGDTVIFKPISKKQFENWEI